MYYQNPIFVHGNFKRIEEALYNVATGNIVVGQVPAALSPIQIEELYQKIQNKTKKRKDIPGKALGPSLFQHIGNHQLYFDESHKIQKALSPIYNELPNELRFDKGVTYPSYSNMPIKPLSSQGLNAIPWRVLDFATAEPGGTILRRHDDVSSTKSFTSLPISKAPFVLGSNVYIKGVTGSILTIYNKIADIDFRKWHDNTYGTNTVQTGYGYHAKALKDVEVMEVELNDGDFCVLNTCYIHGVNLRTKQATGLRRLSLNGFLAPVVHKLTGAKYLATYC